MKPTNEAQKLRGLDLRYWLTAHVHHHGPTTIGDLVSALARSGCQVAGRPSKTVSDALRWEVRRARVVRLGRGRYGPGVMPRTTRQRIEARARVLTRAG